MGLDKVYEHTDTHRGATTIDSIYTLRWDAILFSRQFHIVQPVSHVGRHAVRYRLLLRLSDVPQMGDRRQCELSRIPRHVYRRYILGG